MKSFKKIAIAFGSLALGVGIIGAVLTARVIPQQTKATATDYSWTPTVQNFGAEAAATTYDFGNGKSPSGSVSITSGITVTWDYSFTLLSGQSFVRLKTDASKGLTFGESGKAESGASFSAPVSSFGAVSKVVVNAARNSSATAVLSVSVGGTALLTENALTTSATDYTGTLETPASTGDIVISFSGNTAAKSFYLKSITISFTSAEPTAANFALWMAGKKTGDATTGVTNSSTCLANYTDAKNKVKALSTTELTTLQTSSDESIALAKTRYLNWCTSVGDISPWSGTIVGGSANLIKSNIANNDTMVYVVLGAIAAAAFGGYFFLRKKKENA